MGAVSTLAGATVTFGRYRCNAEDSQGIESTEVTVFASETTVKDLIEQKDERVEGKGFAKRRRVWVWIVASLLIAIAVLGVIGEVVVHRAVPILKGRVIETLSTRFNSRVEMDGFDVSLVKGLEVSGSGLRIFPEDGVVAAGATEPLISLGRFSFMRIGLGYLPSRCM